MPDFLVWAAALFLATPPAQDLPEVLDSIVVTAQKREENLQEVPLSVTAFSMDQIGDATIQTPEDFIALTPNVSMAQSFTVGNSFLTVRGITQFNNSDPPVAVVVDGVYQGNLKQFSQELFDVERIEVLRGPQGALYGRNSLGGAINLVTRPPSERLEGYLRASAGTGSTTGASVAVRGPLAGSRLRYSLTGAYKDSDGLIENVYRGREADPYRDTGGRLRLLWLPREGASVELRSQVSETEGG
ncbi:MAG TPA: TonB-dependent receptor plug domain-containing protein, partial [Thermoanaerobaculia bacterium]|nr:TonB-dependent receptor plug domain-containing protein [Thermoanaerobaculia bacterium]